VTLKSVHPSWTELTVGATAFHPAGDCPLPSARHLETSRQGVAPRATPLEDPLSQPNLSTLPSRNFRRPLSKGFERMTVLSDADYRALADWRSSLRQFLAFSEKVATSGGLTPQHYQAILAIKARTQDENFSIGDLARELLIRPQSGVELVDRLEAGGLVDRATDTGDRRRTVLKLTNKAEQLLSQLAANHLNELRGMVPMLEQLLERIRNRDTEN
jgi:DNA-binding MarR family transcriptional regulator